MMHLVILTAAAMVSPLAAAPKYNYGHETSVALQEMRDSIEDVRNGFRNHEAEIRTYEEKLTSQESIIDGLRDQIASFSQTQENQLKGSTASLEMKLNSLDTAVKGLIADLKQFKTHANETAAALAQSNQKIAQLEKMIEVQNQNAANMQAAMRSLMDAMDVKTAVVDSSGGKSYKVKAGDNLEKIARAHQTTIRAIKELNGLSQDRIIVGQNLKIP